jgi:hypothetical protein
MPKGLRGYPSVIPELESAMSATFDLIECGHTFQQTYAPLSDTEWGTP